MESEQWASHLLSAFSGVILGIIATHYKLGREVFSLRSELAVAVSAIRRLERKWEEQNGKRISDNF